MKPKNSREMQTFLADAQKLVTSLEWLAHQSADLEAMGNTKQKDDDLIERNSGGRRKMSGSPRLDTTGWPEARRTWRQLRRKTAHAARELDKMKAAVMELHDGPPADASVRPDYDLSGVEFAQALKRQRERKAQGEFTPVRVSAQPQAAGS